jgi:GntR family transcriptional regulator, rspAB operon transcriptional repressor
LAKIIARGKNHRMLVPATLSEKVYAAFKHDIVYGVFQPGEPLSEKDLAHRYKASRTPVREAAVRLQNDRLLRIVPNRGYFVAHISLQVLNDIYEFRSAVECAAAELAAAKGPTPEALKQLTELAKVTCTPENRERCLRFIEADTAFHLGIARLARNQMLLQAVSEVRSQMERIMFAAIDINYFGEVPGQEHREILSAIKDRDPGRARQAMHDHIMQSKDKVLGVAYTMPVRSSMG